MRSIWKYKPILGFKDKNSLSKIFETAKLDINENLLSKRVSVYNGKKLESLIVRSYMLGKKFSYFISSKYNGKNIHIKKKKRKNK